LAASKKQSNKQRGKTMQLTLELLAALRIPALWLEPLNFAMQRFQINTPKRVAAFLGQCAHESAGFTVLAENLNYRMEALVQMWPRRFPSLGEAAPYHRQPEKIANRAYANRMGNGDEASGDGWLYRGRGVIQLTGKDNYQLASDALRVDIVRNPDMVLQPELAALTAAWFWNKHGLNELADKGDTATITKRINGGTHGMDDRLQRTSTALALLTRPGNIGNTDTATA
jgi:putative chitinase